MSTDATNPKPCSMSSSHNIIQLHGYVSFYIWHLTWASTILPSWEEKCQFYSKNIVNSVGIFNYGFIIDRNLKESYWDE